MSNRIIWYGENPVIMLDGKIYFNELHHLNDYFISLEKFDTMRFQVWDFSNIERMIISKQELEIMKVLTASSSMWNDKLKIALVANDPHTRDICEDYKEHIKKTTWKAELFHETEKAKHWCMS